MSAWSLFRDDAPRVETPGCAWCGHPSHDKKLVDFGAGPTDRVGRYCLGCDACRRDP